MVRFTMPVVSAFFLTGLALSAPAHAGDSLGFQGDNPPGCEFLMGDVDGSDAVDDDDVSALLAYLFQGGFIFDEVADTNGDGSISVADVVYLANFVRNDGRPPVTDILPGDANGDDRLDYADLTTLAHYLTGQSDNICMTGADINRDGRVDIADLSELPDHL